MPLSWQGWLNTSCSDQLTTGTKTRWILLLFAMWLVLAKAMTPARIAELRQETVAMFYHGFDNYMDVAFPEDEVGRTR
jgi:hypothetical protein